MYIKYYASELINMVIILIMYSDLNYITYL